MAFAIIEKQMPVILGVSFGPGFLQQEKKTNEKIGAPPTMCSLDDNTLVPEIHESIKVFGRPVNPGDAAVAGGRWNQSPEERLPLSPITMTSQKASKENLNWWLLLDESPKITRIRMQDSFIKVLVEKW